MDILQFGAGGHIGRGVAAELLARGHRVTGASRSGTLDLPAHPALSVVEADATDPDAVAALIGEHDAVVSTVGPKIGREDDHTVLVGAANGITAAARRTQRTRRIVVLGGAGTLTTPGGTLVMDDPHFPAEWRANAEAQGAALELYRRADDLEWTFISPAAVIEPGPRTGRYRTGRDELLVDADGRSAISIADYAVAFCDEVESGAHPRQRIAVAY